MQIKNIPDYNGLYYVREDGRVFKCDGREMKGNINSYGYRVVSLTKDGVKKDHKVHRLVAMAFIPNPNDYGCVNHKDGNKLNNAMSNLEWCTKGYNNYHARSILGVDVSQKAVVQKDMNGHVLAIWKNISTAAMITGCSAQLIANCCHGTAKSTGDYRWEFADTHCSDFMQLEQIKAINSEIERLCQEMKQLL